MVTLDKILGQEKPLEIIDRIIEQGKRGQALLLIGRPGIGKFALANYAAGRFLCQTNNSGCGKCISCRNLANQGHPDFLLVFPFPNVASESKKNTLFHFSDPANSDARYSNDTLEQVNSFLAEKADDPYRIVAFKKKGNIPVSVVKDLIRAISKRPMLGNRRAVVVCDIDQMAYGAADLFLKTVEEPPEDSLIILTTSQPQALLPTLLSRTTKICLSPISDRLVRKYLDNHGANEATDFFIRYGAGSPGLALKAFEDDLITKRNELWKIISHYIDNAPLPITIESLRRKYQWRNDFDEIRRDFDLFEKILRDIYIMKIGLDKSLINIDITSELSKCIQAAPSPVVLRDWFKILAKASRVHRVNNVSADIAFVGAFIEFDRARMQG
jgi:DNA polymerase-3 subunit delta'